MCLVSLGEEDRASFFIVLGIQRLIVSIARVGFHVRLQLTQADPTKVEVTVRAFNMIAARVLFDRDVARRTGLCVLFHPVYIEGKEAV